MIKKCTKRARFKKRLDQENACDHKKKGESKKEKVVAIVILNLKSVVVIEKKWRPDLKKPPKILKTPIFTHSTYLFNPTITDLTFSYTLKNHSKPSLLTKYYFNS